MSYSYSQSVNPNIRHSNEGQLSAIKLEHPLLSSPDCTAGSFFYPLRSHIVFLSFPLLFYLITGSILYFQWSPIAQEIYVSQKIRHSRDRTAIVRPSVRTTGIPMLNLTLSSQFGSLQPDIVHPRCYQLTAVKTVYPLTSIVWPYHGLSYRPTEFECFFEVIH